MTFVEQSKAYTIERLEPNTCNNFIYLVILFLIKHSEHKRSTRSLLHVTQGSQHRITRKVIINWTQAPNSSTADVMFPFGNCTNGIVNVNTGMRLKLNKKKMNSVFIKISKAVFNLVICTSDLNCILGIYLAI